ncbi:MAG: methionyl-tRNA formyltransferase [Halopseudomonas sp.]
MQNPPLRIVFAGTPEFAAANLEALINSRHQVVAVYTPPDKSGKKGKKLIPSPVKQLAQQTGITVCQPLSLKSDDEQQMLARFDADLMVVVAYGQLLPKVVLETPKLGCINVHASLLPRWRGAAPIERAIMAGDQQTGVTIMQMDEGLDTGDMLYIQSCPIYEHDTAGTLGERLMGLGSTALLETIEQLAGGKAIPTSQNDKNANYAHKLEKEESELDWRHSAEQLCRKIRGLNPSRVAFSRLNDERIRIWEAEVEDGNSDQSPGSLINADNRGLAVATGNGILRLTRLQIPGKTKQPVKTLLNGNQDLFRAGNQFDAGNAE